MRAGRVLLVVPATLACGFAVLFAEAVAARVGGGAPEAPGSPDGTFGHGSGTFEMVVLGDSTGSGVGAETQDQGYPRRCATALAARLSRPVHLTVHAVSGARVADVLHDQVPQLEGTHPDLVVVLVGGNDVIGLTPPGSARRDLDAVLGAVAETGARVLVVGIPDLGSIKRVAQPLRSLLGALGERYDRDWRKVTSARGMERVEMAAETGPAFRSRPGLFSGDGFHPGPAGYAVWAEVIDRGIARLYP